MIAQFIRDLSSEIGNTRRPETPTDLVAAAREQWEKFDAVYWANADNADKSWTNADYPAFVQRCLKRASDALRALEQAEVTAGVRVSVTPAARWPYR